MADVLDGAPVECLVLISRLHPNFRYRHGMPMAAYFSDKHIMYISLWNYYFLYLHFVSEEEYIRMVFSRSKETLKQETTVLRWALFSDTKKWQVVAMCNLYQGRASSIKRVLSSQYISRSQDQLIYTNSWFAESSINLLFLLPHSLLMYFFWLETFVL